MTENHAQPRKLRSFADQNTDTADGVVEELENLFQTLGRSSDPAFCVFLAEWPDAKSNSTTRHQAFVFGCQGTTFKGLPDWYHSCEREACTTKLHWARVLFVNETTMTIHGTVVGEFSKFHAAFDLCYPRWLQSNMGCIERNTALFDELAQAGVFHYDHGKPVTWTGPLTLRQQL
ncbi:hypothetical protein BD410DRAFT_810590 [Rickenella mellea]|uniref:Uncharacterized protein n=1 Tax=Rickenella mellea TaxID=50990 RepID=A0A4Y7PDQ4_9AGAM|nr:hypothetical protein BD410DRAFT_810590 [Rickenella mellea]